MNKNFDQMTNHLEFLGYTIEKQPAQKEGDKDIFYATSAKYPNLVAIELEPGIAMFRSNFNIEKSASTEMDTALNNLSSKLDITNAYYELNNNKVILRFESVYTGEYSKEIFGKFIAYLNKDINKMYLIEDVKKVLI